LDERFTAPTAVILIMNNGLRGRYVFSATEGLHCPQGQIECLGYLLISNADAFHFFYGLFLVISHVPSSVLRDTPSTSYRTGGAQNRTENRKRPVEMKINHLHGSE
jgi:hypothetical protein